MRLVIVTVEVYTIPALGEEDLVADTILALVDIGEVDILALSISRVVRHGAAVV